MSAADYAPGTVAVATVRGVEGVRVFRYEDIYDRWDSARPVKDMVVHADSDVTDVRPLVVLDLTEYEANELASWLDGTDAHMGIYDRVRVARQIRRQTKQPRIPEPGLWGVVEASMDAGTTRSTWVRTPEFWYTAKWDSARSWSDLSDPTLIREGVES